MELKKSQNVFDFKNLFFLYPLFLAFLAHFFLASSKYFQFPIQIGLLYFFPIPGFIASRSFKWTIFSTSKVHLMANKHIKRCSTSLAFREIPIKTTRRYYYTLLSMAEMKNCDNTQHWHGCRETESLTYCWWECKTVQPLWKQFDSFL